mmetsp:Transcript_2024/g.5339  ORF Transcript_2024/g.5339 Transcript_2024/m.5339 type:complete len:367 (+) Transcript_2024:2293-3393(+)
MGDLQGLLRADLDQPLPERARGRHRPVLRALHPVGRQAPSQARRVRRSRQLHGLRSVVDLHDGAPDAHQSRHLRQRGHPARHPGGLQPRMDAHRAPAPGRRFPERLPPQGGGHLQQGEARGPSAGLPTRRHRRHAPGRSGVLSDQLHAQHGPREAARVWPPSGILPGEGTGGRAGARPGAQAAQGAGGDREGPLRLHDLPRRPLPEGRHPQGRPGPGRRPGRREGPRRGRRGVPRPSVDQVGVLRRDRHQAPAARPRVVPGDRPPGALHAVRGLLPDLERRPVPRGLRDEEELLPPRRRLGVRENEASRDGNRSNRIEPARTRTRRLSLASHRTASDFAMACARSEAGKHMHAYLVIALTGNNKKY